MKRRVVTYLFTFVLLSCGVQPTTNRIIEGKASVKNFLCSRGCNQWVIVMNDGQRDTYYIDTTARMDDYKIDDIAIWIKAKPFNQQISITKPGADDKPIHDFNAQLIAIDSISMINAPMK